MRNREIERQIRETASSAGERVRNYADDATSSAQSLLERGRRRINKRFGKGSVAYGQQLSHAAEDMADEANYHYRRLRRQVNRHPAASVAILAGTVGAFLLLRRAFQSNSNSDD